MLKIGNNFNNDYYFNCKLLYRIVDQYINKITNHHYETTINNTSYKTLVLIDKPVLKTTIINNSWIEYNRYCAYFNDKPILIEQNKYYPYKKLIKK